MKYNILPRYISEKPEPHKPLIFTIYQLNCKCGDNQLNTSPGQIWADSVCRFVIQPDWNVALFHLFVFCHESMYSYDVLQYKGEWLCVHFCFVIVTHKKAHTCIVICFNKTTKKWQCRKTFDLNIEEWHDDERIKKCWSVLIMHNIQKARFKLYVKIGFINTIATNITPPVKLAKVLISISFLLVFLTLQFIIKIKVHTVIKICTWY